MTYTLVYMLIGAATFWPMLRYDNECRDYVVLGGFWSIALALAIWSVVWLPSIMVDGIFWLMDRD